MSVAPTEKSRLHAIKSTSGATGPVKVNKETDERYQRVAQKIRDRARSGGKSSHGRMDSMGLGSSDTEITAASCPSYLPPLVISFLLYIYNALIKPWDPRFDLWTSERWIISAWIVGLVLATSTERVTFKMAIDEMIPYRYLLLLLMLFSSMVASAS